MLNTEANLRNVDKVFIRRKIESWRLKIEKKSRGFSVKVNIQVIMFTVVKKVPERTSFV